MNDETSPLAAVTNYIQMTESLGTSGQPTREQFALIAQAGYKTVVNLAMPDSNHAIADEGTVVSALGMKYVHIPVPMAEPGAAHLRAFIGVMRALEGEKVWVHCVVNARVSAFSYKYLRLEKSFDDAAARNWMLARWEPKMDTAWTRFMRLAKEDLNNP